METSGNANHAFRDTDPSHRFNPPQAALPNRRARPPPMDLSCSDEPEIRVPLAPKGLDRRASKGGLRGMFTRTKAQAEKSAVVPLKEETTQSSPSTASSRSLALSTQTTVTPSTPVTPAIPVQARQSRIAIRSKSVKDVGDKKPAAKSSSKSSNSTSRTPKRTLASWDPPPLFQAFPQAIKHASLTASTLSADVILRMSSHKKSNVLGDDLTPTTEENRPEQNAEVKKTEKTKTKHRRQLSGPKADWTRKLFILVTSGYLLQYAGEGSFDRLPEKVMQLGTESVAFASDAIPGKHWVLQVSQSLNADGAPSSDSRSLLSRLAFRGADYRRSATSLLMIMGSGEDMESWITVIRREIEALGGKKHVSETGKPKPERDNDIMQLRTQPSHRYLIQREPEQVPPPVSRQDDDSLRLAAEGRTHVLRDTNTMKTPNSATNSLDGRHLETLRNSTNRSSYMSSGQRTLITSDNSSASTSPTRESYSTIDDVSPKHSVENQRMGQNGLDTIERRKSMQTVSNPTLEANTSTNPRPHSTYSILATSPAPQNFSVPSSSSRRFSTTSRGLSHKPQVTDTLDVPDIVMSTYDSADIQSKPLPEFPHQNRRSSSSAIERVPIYDSLSKATKSHGHESFTESAASQGLADHELTSTPYSSRSDDQLGEFHFPQRYSVAPKAAETSIGHWAHTALPAFSFPAPLPASPIAQLPTYIPIEHGTSDRPPISFSKQLRRPMSMQIRAESHSKSFVSASYTFGGRASKSLPLPAGDAKYPKRNNTVSHDQPFALPPIHRPRSEDNKKLGARKSMPLLASGPPPAPPPKRSLPPLPPPQNSPLSEPSQNGLQM
ncbi:hypothetical protein GLAREA_01719 [Glarea lozoyensis ATCC 20868]|uniref:PH domain-containing protein n=1 Tax=Glarea lozoyensis (strain ATCC 20868 / MF5171) TaxID=1116229 RepID=S3CH82_GLAL2|nr:uncharacterized protein GLAREA_01719 [Glarea lozoyensis ATCC 20868]EPE25807.1 hypothetical protein GLAREA_01719 [Glarea lozoyensis ATCC 20868]